MSARMPFVPGQGLPPSSRPASRAAPSNNTRNSLQPSPLFTADPSNPLNGGSFLNDTHKERTENSDHAPLNIGSFARRADVAPSRRQSIHSTGTNPVARPGTSDPCDKPAPAMSVNHRLQARASTNSHNIVAPSPRPPRSSFATLSSSSFKTPALPNTPSASSTMDIPIPLNESQSQASDEQPPPCGQEDRSDSPLNLITLPDQPGPHRINFGCRIPNFTDLTQDDQPVAGATAMNRRTRSRAEMEEEEESDDEAATYRGHEKRRKIHQEPQADENAFHRSSNDENEYRRSFSPHEFTVQKHHRRPKSARNLTPAIPEQPLNHRAPLQNAPGAAHKSTRNPGPAMPAQAPRHRTVPNPLVDHADSLVARLLAPAGDDDFIDSEAELDIYARAAEKWKTCSYEEWKAGADELAAKYVKVLDFVKTHMITKAKLFARFDDVAEKQQAILDERETVLDGVRGRLVKEGGNVLGHGR
ncbi:hypothetical protein C8J57DRAFT_1714574 [Mycena rebaudengoi]|nr:hypothetical protein C8J57DRAFT_1714574 [Mycena rebaudengoi]